MVNGEARTYPPLPKTAALFRAFQTDANYIISVPKAGIATGQSHIHSRARCTSTALARWPSGHGKSSTEAFWLTVPLRGQENVSTQVDARCVNTSESDCPWAVGPLGQGSRVFGGDEAFTGWILQSTCAINITWRMPGF